MQIEPNLTDMVTGMLGKCNNNIIDDSILYWCFKKLTFCSKNVGLET